MKCNTIVQSPSRTLTQVPWIGYGGFRSCLQGENGECRGWSWCLGVSSEPPLWRCLADVQQLGAVCLIQGRLLQPLVLFLGLCILFINSCDRKIMVILGICTVKTGTLNKIQLKMFTQRKSNLLLVLGVSLQIFYKYKYINKFKKWFHRKHRGSKDGLFSYLALCVLWFGGLLFSDCLLWT